MPNAADRNNDIPGTYTSPLSPVLPKSRNEWISWGRLYGNSTGLPIFTAAEQYNGLVVVIAPDSQHANRLETELNFYASGSQINIFQLPDWETLPYDLFSPHQDIISQRLETLYHLPDLSKGILIVPVATFMQRLMPNSYLQANSLILETGNQLQPEEMRRKLEQAGYNCVSQVMEHGEFAIRGSLIDLFPMGANTPYRIDLFDDEVESIRTFNPDTQLSIDKVSSIRLLPAREFPLNDESIKKFRQAYRVRFEGDPQQSLVYRDVSQGIAPAGIEYYLPLFFDQTETLQDYLPSSALFISYQDQHIAAEHFREQVEERYEQRRHDTERPILKPDEIYQSEETLSSAIAEHPHISLQGPEIQATQHEQNPVNFATSAPPILLIQARASEPCAALENFVSDYNGRILFAAESTGRREFILETLRGFGLRPEIFETWNAFITSDINIGITVAPLEQGALIQNPPIAIIAEPQIFGERTVQTRRRKKQTTDPDNIIRNLTDLNIGSPVVHEEQGIGRYLGLQKLKMGNLEPEFLTLEYKGGDKLYVPVYSLHLISRYTGSAPENAPLHKLGSDHWQKVKRRAAQRANDVAAELLDIYSRRAARKGHKYHIQENEYTAFSSSFPFEETADQYNAIEAVKQDMNSEQPMDRVICGDVGFGKTEVAMRAAFIAVQEGKQVAVLVPTTLLAQQHYQNFQDRFADWPVRIEVLSRFEGKKSQGATLSGLENGKVDIVIGTHALLQPSIKFKNLGLAIIDEEHRFGVRQKEKMKALRTEVDILTLTATPIPRTLNMSLSGLRDLSLITTPPVDRVAIKTFISEWDDILLNEACQRELKRGGQVYLLHNEVSSIDRMAQRTKELVPEAEVRIAHGQMREKDLEQVMLDFYHQRFNVLVCTTIIESGIDVPSANTIIINRADKLGLAQLHQIRGRVGRSHHRAYAYLLIPDRRSITADAIKRLEAIESLEDLGAGFMLATHDLEIRGAGELLGDEQSGQIHEIGFTLYTELLERAVKALKSGKQPELDQPLDHGPEIDLHIPALLPEDYLPDVHTRLVTYKRIASAKDADELRHLQVEMIDRFGLLPEPAKTLVRITSIKLKASPLGISKINIGPAGGRVIIGDKPNINTENIIQLIQTQPEHYKMGGQNKLQIIMELEDHETRFQTVEDMLDILKPV